MATIESTTRISSPSVQYCERPAAGLRFDRVVVLFSVWITLGTFLDGFAHHNIPDTIETFFTPWHAALYSGLLAFAGFMLFHQARNMARGYAWNRALPVGYSLSALGVFVFGLGGAGDALWHTVFGIEQGVEALLSPTHLMLAAGGLLITTGPIRAAMRRYASDAKPGWTNLLPALLALLFLLSTLTFFTEYVNTLVSPERVIEAPLISTEPEAIVHRLTALGVAGVLIPAALITGVLLFVIRRWTLPAGAVMLLVTGNGLLMSGFHFHEIAKYPQVLVPIVASGLVAELAQAWLQPSSRRIRALRAFAFIVPFALFALFFAVLVGTTGVWWSVHMWIGVPILGGATGLLMSFLAVPGEWDFWRG